MSDLREKIEGMITSESCGHSFYFAPKPETIDEIISLCQPQWISVDKAKLKELADNYAHCYSFVGDDTMPIAQKKLYDAIDALPEPPEKSK